MSEMEIEKIKDDYFKVKSNGKTYWVQYNVFCTCPGWFYKNKCKHMDAVREHLIKELYEKGLNDREIEDKLGLARGVVTRWRQKNNLPPVTSFRKCVICGKKIPKYKNKKYCEECLRQKKKETSYILWIRGKFRKLKKNNLGEALNIFEEMMREEGEEFTRHLLGRNLFKEMMEKYQTHTTHTHHQKT